MGARGPKSQLQLCAVEVGKRVKEPPAPPSGMSVHARKLFVRIVAEHSPGVFDTEAVCLLRQFCEAEVRAVKADKALRKEGEVVTVLTEYGEVRRKNPWLAVWKESNALLTSLSTKLRKKGVTIDQDADTARPKRKLFNG